MKYVMYVYVSLIVLYISYLFIVAFVHTVCDCLK
jgi:hypothetical protein